MKKIKFEVTLRTEDHINIEDLKRILASEPESHQDVFLDNITALSKKKGSYEEFTKNNKMEEKRRNILHIFSTILNNHKGRELTEEQIDVLEQYLVLHQANEIKDSDIKELIEKTLNANMNVVSPAPELAKKYEKLFQKDKTKSKTE